MRRLRRWPAAFVLAAALATGAAGASRAEPGITTTTILLGGTAPLSGADPAAAAAARGADAYFRYVDARGGIDGRTVVYRYVDDAGDAAETVEATRRLVEEDGVFAIVNSVGTEPSLAVRDYLNRQKVPQLFVASGATALGRDWRRYAWTIGFRPSYAAEGSIYGRYLARTRPAARIAVLYEGDAGKDLLAGLRRGIARSKARILAAASYEPALPDVQSQLAELEASGADVLALFARPEVAIQAYSFASELRWRPLVILGADAAGVPARAKGRTVEGSVSLTWVKDPRDPRWRTELARYARGGAAKDAAYVHGLAVGYETVRVLRAAGRTPTRAAVLAQLRRLRDPANPFLLPGIRVETSARDRFPLEQAQLQRWQKGRWRTFGGLWRA